MRLLVDYGKCSGCGTCERICPQKVLAVKDHQLVVVDEVRCMGCFGCEDECPQGAIRLFRAPPGISPEIEPSRTIPSHCDVLVVGAGPAGLGTAISCARAGLQVTVLERLPNRKLSHHTDGGVLFTIPSISSMRIDGQAVSFPELGITLETDFLRKCRSLGILGPNGLATKSSIPTGMEVWAGNKDEFVEALIGQAEKAGAQVCFGCKVVDVVQDGRKICGAGLHDGRVIRSRVVVTADGVLGKISQKAGMPLCRNDLWYASVLAYEFDNTRGLPASLFFINGQMQLEEGMPYTMAAVGITKVIHVLMVFFSRRKFYHAPKPMDFYLEKWLRSDGRIRTVLGGALDGAAPRMLTGCRGVLRSQPCLETARDGAVCVGDAWVNGGEIGNVPALANGIFAGRAIVEASRKNDFSAHSLGTVRRFAGPEILRALAENRKMKLLATQLNETEMKQLFLFMQHLNYPVLMFGKPLQRGLMLANFFLRNALRLFQYPRIARTFFPKGGSLS